MGARIWEHGTDFRTDSTHGFTARGYKNQLERVSAR